MTLPFSQAAPAPRTVPVDIVVHPLVLLSVVDHYNRVAKDSKRRVVGVLLGELFKGRLDITNCFAGVSRRAALQFHPLICCN